MRSSTLKPVVLASLLLVAASTLPRLPWDAMIRFINTEWPLLAAGMVAALGLGVVLLRIRHRPLALVTAARRLANRGAELSVIARRTGLAQDAVRTLLAGNPPGGTSCRPGKSRRTEFARMGATWLNRILESVQRQMLRVIARGEATSACPLPLQRATPFTWEKKS